MFKPFYLCTAPLNPVFCAQNYRSHENVWQMIFCRNDSAKVTEWAKRAPFNQPDVAARTWKLKQKHRMMSLRRTLVERLLQSTMRVFLILIISTVIILSAVSFTPASSSPPHRSSSFLQASPTSTVTEVFGTVKWFNVERVSLHVLLNIHA